ncbi:putative 5-formyltetrahydrofolate cyclo-ligase [Magnetospirillum sp. XM-1]|uniref:5-formyltetrahydrofolate cyclo-ligase n=1 Tax=Magnetospirillum sp. XM-1 TaxID=1663591 RepID=UPI00073DC6AC|nr:5-formyltetrahydrofolate cyclo-ligase [Magnetospirillum sp. XM-1]CUW41192.1 putative 5-formyltetrahydrofolate cyclo-ligase [Magnetospirillum sp. XM-1]
MTEAIAPSAEKTQMRAAARRKRRDAALAHGPAAALALAGLAGALGLAQGSVVAGYWPLEGEIDPLPLMEALASRGHVLALPAVTETGGILEFRRWAPGDALESGPHGTSHPADAPPVTPGALLVPLLAFDRRGFRLGYGGGYYDRTLGGLRRGGALVAVGLAFAAQEVETVPTDSWDIPLDLIATEQGVIVTAGK